MLTSGKIETTKFSSFRELATEINRADVRKAEGLRKTRAARAANKRKKAR